MTATWMPAGYMRNIVETVKVTAVQGEDDEKNDPFLLGLDNQLCGTS